LRTRIDHRNKDTRPVCNIRRAFGHLGSKGSELRILFSVEVVDNKRMAGLEDILCHGAAHRA
jgi:hypothetical protein